MYKKGVFIVNLHNKFRINCVSLLTFNSVIINITKLTFGKSANFLKVKGFKAYLKPFFYVKKSLLLTYKP